MDERTRVRIWDKYEGQCAICGGPGEEIDHIIPRSKAPPKSKYRKEVIEQDSNYRLICRPCHHKKHHGGRLIT